MVAVVLFGSLYRSYLEQNKTKNGAGFPFVGWCMINTVSKNHIKIRKIERGIAKQRLCQHLSWPSSYKCVVWNTSGDTECDSLLNRAACTPQPWSPHIITAWKGRRHGTFCTFDLILTATRCRITLHVRRDHDSRLNRKREDVTASAVSYTHLTLPTILLV